MSTFDANCFRAAGPSLGLWDARRPPVEVEAVPKPPRVVRPGPARSGRQDQYVDWLASVAASCVGGCLGVGYDPAPAGTDAYWRWMDLDPAVVLAKAAITSAVREVGWSWEAREGTPDRWVKAAQESFDRLIPAYVAACCADLLPMGRKPFEVVYGERDGKTVIGDLRPLRPEAVTPLIDRAGGEFAGVQVQRRTGGTVDLDPAYVLNVVTDDGSRDPYGRTWYAPGRQSFWSKLRDLERLAKVGDKASGTQAIVRYPPHPDEAEKGTHGALAKVLAQQAMRGESLTIPNASGALTSEFAQDAQHIKGLAEAALWSVEFPQFTETGPQITALMALIAMWDVALSRAIKVPERATQTSTGGGTNAESQTQSGVNQAVSQLLVDDLAAALSHGNGVGLGPVDTLMTSRFGPKARGAVTLRAGKVRDVYATADWKVLDAVLGDPTMLLALATREVDVDALLTRRGIPKTKASVDLLEAVRQVQAEQAANPQPADPTAPGGGQGQRQGGGGEPPDAIDAATSLDELRAALGRRVSLARSGGRQRDGDHDGKVTGPDGKDDVPVSGGAAAADDGPHPLQRPGESDEAFAARVKAKAEQLGATPDEAAGLAGEGADDDEAEERAAAEREEAEQLADEDREAAERFRDGTVAEYSGKLKEAADDAVERVRAARFDVDTEAGVVDPADYQPGGQRYRANGEQTDAEVRETFAADRESAEDSLRASLDDARTEVGDAVRDARDEMRDHASDFRVEAADYLAAAHDKPAARAVVAEGRKALAERTAAELARVKEVARSAGARLARQHREQVDGLRAVTLKLTSEQVAD